MKFWRVRTVLTMTVAMAFCSGQSVLAQGVVQLPTLNVFSVGTTVVVPDRGSAFLGGSSSSFSGRNSSGVPLVGGRPFTNVGIGRTSAAGGASLSAQIHDLEAMDAALLAQTESANDRRQADIGGVTAVASVAQMRAAADADAKTRQQQASYYFAHAQQLIKEGKPAVAKVYFQMAARSGSADVQQQALAALKSLERSSTSASVTAR